MPVKKTKTAQKKVVAKKTISKFETKSVAKTKVSRKATRKSKVPSVKVIPSTAKGVVVDMTFKSKDSDVNN